MIKTWKAIQIKCCTALAMDNFENTIKLTKTINQFKYEIWFPFLYISLVSETQLF